MHSDEYFPSWFMRCVSFGFNYLLYAAYCFIHIMVLLLVSAHISNMKGELYFVMCVKHVFGLPLRVAHIAQMIR